MGTVPSPGGGATATARRGVSQPARASALLAANAVIRRRRDKVGRTSSVRGLTMEASRVASLIVSPAEGGRRSTMFSIIIEVMAKTNHRQVNRALRWTKSTAIHVLS